MTPDRSVPSLLTSVPPPPPPWQVLDKDFVLPIGKATVMRTGSHVTITAHSKMVGFALQAAEQLAAEGIEAEVR